MVLNQNIQPETIVDAMLTSEASWNATSTFSASLVTRLEPENKPVAFGFKINTLNASQPQPKPFSIYFDLGN
ncbi:hypothetical protein EVAR_38701_1 [Eumeta japonica]|uniref:Uncharacterized protein n=1 Tax=Eumeta variegata TaxID=151549 RepID=A0A4C1XNR5_EUMVA|nr:hypothetical protein EVAR_38701_1 [Eumeta japonica]